MRKNNLRWIVILTVFNRIQCKKIDSDRKIGDRIFFQTIVCLYICMWNTEKFHLISNETRKQQMYVVYFIIVYYIHMFHIEIVTIYMSKNWFTLTGFILIVCILYMKHKRKNMEIVCYFCSALRAQLSEYCIHSSKSRSDYAIQYYHLQWWWCR